MQTYSTSLPHINTPEGMVPLHSPNDFKEMRKAGQLAAQVLDHVTPLVYPGVTTEALNDACATFIRQAGAIAAPLGYKGYPKSICTSVNHVVCHGIPNNKPLRKGDSINIDVTVILNGWHGDTSRMFLVGETLADTTHEKRHLLNTTQKALDAAIALVRPGIFLGDIGAAIQNIAHQAGLSVVTGYCGHGIGKVFHMPPSVLHFGEKGTGLELQEGMFFTIEPMLNLGKAGTKVLADGWTVVTRDKSLSAQCEHTLGVTASGCEIFTRA